MEQLVEFWEFLGMAYGVTLLALVFVMIPILILAQWAAEEWFGQERRY